MRIRGSRRGGPLFLWGRSRERRNDYRFYYHKVPRGYQWRKITTQINKHPKKSSIFGMSEGNTGRTKKLSVPTLPANFDKQPPPKISTGFPVCILKCHGLPAGANLTPCGSDRLCSLPSGRMSRRSSHSDFWTASPRDFGVNSPDTFQSHKLLYV